MDLSKRLPGPDVVRAVAMFGVVVMNYHGYLLIRGGQRGDGALDDLFDPWTGPLSTRFAATFVLVAGVGVTLMTRSSIGDAERVTEMRWRLVRRGLLLYAGGLLFDFVWPGTILPFYGAMFVLAAVLFTLRSRWLVLIGIVAALAGWLIRWWVYERFVDGSLDRLADRPGGAVAARARVRPVRQRHPSAAAVVGVLRRRHRARPAVPARRLATGHDRGRLRAVLDRDHGHHARHDRARQASC